MYFSISSTKLTSRVDLDALLGVALMLSFLILNSKSLIYDSSFYRKLLSPVGYTNLDSLILESPKE